MKEHQKYKERRAPWLRDGNPLNMIGDLPVAIRDVYSMTSHPVPVLGGATTPQVQSYRFMHPAINSVGLTYETSPQC